MAPTPKGTYVYAVIAASARPTLPRGKKGLTDGGVLRFLDLGERLKDGKGSPMKAGRRPWLLVADVPLARYGSDQINSRLGDLDWVSRAAVAHERAVEAFLGAAALVPMQLFTIFMNDERALDHFAGKRQHILRMLERVAHHAEWGVRVTFDRRRLAGRLRPATKESSSGASYLKRKKTQRDELAGMAEHGREAIQRLYEALGAQATLARRRTAAELPAADGPLLLDAVFLVSRGRTARFRSALTRAARQLEQQGCSTSATGPWPPYSFVDG